MSDEIDHVTVTSVTLHQPCEAGIRVCHTLVESKYARKGAVLTLAHNRFFPIAGGPWVVVCAGHEGESSEHVDRWSRVTDVAWSGGAIE